MGVAVLFEDGKRNLWGIAVHERRTVRIIGHDHVKLALARVLHLDGHGLGMRVTGIARLCATVLGDGVGEGLSDVGQRVVERPERDVAVGVVRLYVKFVAPLVPQAERELSVLELTALQSCRGPKLDRPRCLTGHEDICPLGLSGYPVYGSGCLVRDFPILDALVILLLVGGEVSGLRDWNT